MNNPKPTNFDPPTSDPQRTGTQSDSRILRTAKVMMVDDEPITLEVVRAFLEDAGYRNFIVTSEPKEAMDLVASERPDVVLLDLVMPEVSGFDILKAMRADATFRHIPVIMLTSASDAATKLQALELGATDFLGKPVDPSELILRTRNTLAAKAYVDRVTYFDSLTGLHNRQMFVDHMDWTLRQVERYNRAGALLHINIDRFKNINDALGPALGDQLLKAIARRFSECIRTSDTLGQIDDKRTLPSLSRLGSDEFAVLLGQIDKTESAAIVAQRLIQAMTPPFNIGGRDIFATCSIGIAVFPADGKERDAVLQRAAIALHVAKQRGGNTHCYFSKDLNDRSLQYLSLQTDLRRAIDRNEFQLFYQPKIDTRSRQLVGAEALLRWNHPERGMVGPFEFIPVAEETGLIVPIGAWVIEEACRQITAWQKNGLAPVKISVNVSGRQFRENNFLATVRGALGQSAVDPEYLQIELTESILMQNASENIRILGQLKDLGLRLSIDDFGTGYSSLSYLGQFPLDELKIDRSFLKVIDDKATRKSAPIVVAIIALAHSLDLSVVAEGVETEAQWKFLHDQECNECQGYLFGKPVPVADFTALLSGKIRLRA